MRVQDEEVIFNVFSALKCSSASDNCFHIDEQNYMMSTKLTQPKKPLETCLVMSDLSMVRDVEVEKYALWMDSYGKNNQKYDETLS